jgi:hypothetical protein
MGVKNEKGYWGRYFMYACQSKPGREKPRSVWDFVVSELIVGQIQGLKNEM